MVLVFYFGGQEALHSWSIGETSDASPWRRGLMDRLFKGFQLMMGPVPGSLYIGVLITATIFGIAAGTVGATVVLMGIMAVPLMTKAGYDIRMSAGAITAGGTLGILVPPSVMLVVMGPVMGVSVAELSPRALAPASSWPRSSSPTR